MSYRKDGQVSWWRAVLEVEGGTYSLVCYYGLAVTAFDGEGFFAGVGAGR